MAKKKAVVLGVGAERGLGAAASRRFAKEGYHVLVAGRTAAKIEKVADSIRAAGGSATPVTVDGTKEAEVIALFDKAMADDADGAPVDLAVFNMGNNAAVDIREMTAQHFEDSWRVGCFAGFLFGREAVRRLAPLGRGTVIFTGASGSRGGRGAAGRASPPSTPPRAACGCWCSRWRANSARRASTSRTPSSTAASRATVCCRACPTARTRPAPTVF
jgi:NAD(P)-dependent dehydrogenase (short-subunit alcohol dehydrogenase family)